MKASLGFLFTVGVVLMLVLGACGNSAPISDAATQPPAESGNLADPAEVVNGFYAWYLAYEGNVLADRAYQTRGDLTDEFIGQVDTTLDSFDKGGYDPFLCAQDIPQSIQVEAVDVVGETAQVTMTTSFEGHRLGLSLRTDGEGWQIDGITCVFENAEDVRPAPTVVVNEFYSWYLGYQGNVLVDGAYRNRPELSPALVAEVDALMADRPMGMGDPFLCAQGRPGTFDLQLVEGSGESAQIEVSTDFENHSFRVTVGWDEGDGGRWLITDVTCNAPDAGEAEAAQPPADSAPVAGNLFRDETFGYALVLPDGWIFEDVNLNEPGRPPAGKMERILHLMPEGWDEQYLPLILEVYAMSAADLEREIMPADARETLEINGLTVVKNIYPFGEREMVKYDVQAPNTEDLHVVLTDFLTGWPDRLEGNEETAGQIQEILNSLTFAQ